MSEIEIGSGGLRRLTINTGTVQGLDPTKILAGDGISVTRDLVASTATVSIDHSYPNEFLDGQSAVPGPYHGWGWKGTSSSTPSAGVMGVGLAGGCFGVEAHSYGDAIPLLARVGLTVPPTPFGILSLTGAGEPKVALMLERSEADAGDGVRLLARNTLSDSAVSASSGAIDFKLSPNTVAGQSGYVKTLVNQGGALIEKFRVTEAGAAVVSGENSPSYLNWDWTQGESGYGFRNCLGTLQYKNLGGAWAPFGSGGTSGWIDTHAPVQPLVVSAKWVGQDRLLFSNTNDPESGATDDYNQQIIDQEIVVARDIGFASPVYGAKVGVQYEHELPVSASVLIDSFQRGDIGGAALRPDEWPEMKASGWFADGISWGAAGDNSTDFIAAGVAVGDSVQVYCLRDSDNLPDPYTFYQTEVSLVLQHTLNFRYDIPISKLTASAGRTFRYRVGNLAWASTVKDADGRSGLVGWCDWQAKAGMVHASTSGPDGFNSIFNIYQPTCETEDQNVYAEFEFASPFCNSHFALLARARNHNSTTASPPDYASYYAGAIQYGNQQFLGGVVGWLEKQGTGTYDAASWPQVAAGGFAALRCYPETEGTATITAGATSIAISECAGFDASWTSAAGDATYGASSMVVDTPGWDMSLVEPGDTVVVAGVGGGFKTNVSRVDSATATIHYEQWYCDEGSEPTTVPPDTAQFTVQRKSYGLLRQTVAGAYAKHEIVEIAAVSAVSGAGTLTVTRAQRGTTAKPFSVGSVGGSTCVLKVGQMRVPPSGVRHTADFFAYSLHDAGSRTWLQLKVNGNVVADWNDAPHAPLTYTVSSVVAPADQEAPFVGIWRVNMTASVAATVLHGDTILFGTSSPIGAMVTMVSGSSVFCIPDISVGGIDTVVAGATATIYNPAFDWAGQVGYGALDLYTYGYPPNGVGTRIHEFRMSYRDQPASDLYLKTRMRNNVGWGAWSDPVLISASVSPAPQLFAFNSLPGSHVVYWQDGLAGDISGYYLKAWDAKTGGNLLYAATVAKGTTTYILPYDGTHLTMYWEMAPLTPSGLGDFSDERTATTTASIGGSDGYWSKATGETVIYPTDTNNTVRIGTADPVPYLAVGSALQVEGFTGESAIAGVIGGDSGTEDNAARCAVMGVVPKDFLYPWGLVGIHFGGGFAGGLSTYRRTDLDTQAAVSGSVTTPLLIRAPKVNDLLVGQSSAVGDAVGIDFGMGFSVAEDGGTELAQTEVRFGKAYVALTAAGAHAVRESEFRFDNLVPGPAFLRAADIGATGTATNYGSRLRLHADGTGVNRITSYVDSAPTAFGVLKLDALAATVTGTAVSPGELRVMPTSGSSYYQALRANGAVTGSQTFVLPDGYGTAGYALVTDGAGNLSWASAGATPGTNQGWTDDGTTVRLTTSSDQVSIGSSTAFSQSFTPRLSVFPYQSGAGIGIDSNYTSISAPAWYLWKGSSWVGAYYYSASGANQQLGIHAKQLVLGVSATAGQSGTNPHYAFSEAATTGMGLDSTAIGPCFYSRNIKSALIKNSANASFFNLLHGSTGATQTNYLGCYASDGTTACIMQLLSASLRMPNGSLTEPALGWGGGTYGLYYTDVVEGRGLGLKISSNKHFDFGRYYGLGPGGSYYYYTAARLTLISSAANAFNVIRSQTGETSETLGTLANLTFQTSSTSGLSANGLSQFFATHVDTAPTFYIGDGKGTGGANGKLYISNAVGVGEQVLTKRQPAVADATDAASTMARLNDLLARLRTHGLIAT